MARHWEASTSRTWLVPMPKATAPKAPWVEVWLSPQAIVIPGWVSPSSGPMTWTMPRRGSSMPRRGISNSEAFSSMATIIRSARSSRKGRSLMSVGMMWSTVAQVRSGCITRRPRSRSI